MELLHRQGDLVARLAYGTVERSVVMFRCLDEVASHVGGLESLLECGGLFDLLLAIVRYDQEETEEYPLPSATWCKGETSRHRRSSLPKAWT